MDILGLYGRPLPSFCQSFVVVEDVLFDLVFQVLYGNKVPSVEDMFVKDAEPDFNGVEPATMLGRIEEADAMPGIAEISLSGLHALEYARFAFFAQDLLIPKGLGDEADQGLALVSIKLITQDDKTRRRVGLDQSYDMFDKVRFGSGVGNRWGDELASGQVDIAGYDLRAMPDVVKLPAFDLVWLSG